MSNPSTNIFERTRSKQKPASEPTLPTQKRAKVARQTIEETGSLSNDELIQMISPMDRASIVKTFMERSTITSNSVPSIYSSYFFRKDIVTAYMNDLTNAIPTDRLPSSPLSKYNLYNKDDILNNIMTRPDEIGTRYTEKTTSYTDMSIDTIGKVIRYLSSSVCVGIKQAYAQKGIENAIMTIKRTKKKDIASGKMVMAVSSVDISDYFDILLVSTKKIEDFTLPIEQRLSEVAAFIVVELGECAMYPLSYSINLICADTRKGTGIGSILMGAYLYTILSHPSVESPLSSMTDNVDFPPGNSYLQVTTKPSSIEGQTIGTVKFGTDEPLIDTQHIAVLELADAYENVGGLCMYEKYGFTFDPSMFAPNCFTDKANLPMIIDFNEKPGYKELDLAAKKAKIIAITIGSDKGFPKDIICSLREDRQKLLGLLKSIKVSKIVDPTYKYDDLMNQYQKVYNTILYINEPQSSLTVRARLPPSRPGTVDEFIDYLEANPQPTNNLDMESKINKLISYLPKVKPTKGGKRRRTSKVFKKTKTTFSKSRRKKYTFSTSKKSRTK